MRAVAERLREAGLDVRELPDEMLIRNPREPGLGLVSVALDDPDDIFVNWEHAEQESFGIDYPETDEDAALIATEVLQLIGGDTAGGQHLITGPGEVVEEAELLAGDLAASWHVWYADGWHAAPRQVYGWTLEASSAAMLRDRAETETADRIPQLRAQLAEAETAAERLRTRRPSRDWSAGGGR
jgi:hypothetical protein